MDFFFFISGGWGSRKLTLIPPDDAGYMGTHLKTASQGGKGTLYIAPLQTQLDTTPLSPSSPSFNEMAKEQCQKCGVLYPLVILSTHVKTCEVIEVEDESDQVSNLI